MIKEDDTTVIKLKDNGIGIPSENLKRIKESFYRVDYSAEGLGLGLYISENIIKKHNGSLDIASIQGEGTEITIKLK